MTRYRVAEDASKVITQTVTGPDGTAVPGSAITSALLTLYDWDTGAGSFNASPADGIINARNAQEMVGDPSFSLSEAGVLTWTMDPGDNPIVTPRRQIERHRALFVLIWTALGSPAQAGSATVEVEIDVENLRKTA